MPEVSDSLSAVIGWRALKSARALADPQKCASCARALQAFDLTRGAGIIGPRVDRRQLTNL
jgi:hypothetical protein